MTSKDITRKIKKLLKESGLTQYAFSKKVHMSRNTLYNMLLRETMPTIPVLEKICSGFGMTVSQFLAGPNEIFMPDEEKKIIADYRKLSDKDKSVVEGFIKGKISE